MTLTNVGGREIEKLFCGQVLTGKEEDVKCHVNLAWDERLGLI